MRLLGAFATLISLAPLMVSVPALATSCITPVPHSNADCLDASWDNDPAARIRFIIDGALPASSRYSATNTCSQYASMVVKIDLDTGSDEIGSDGIWTLDSSSTRHGSASLADVENIYCCIGNHGLCARNQVEADGQGRIQHWNLSAGTFEWVDVSTRDARYYYCQDYSNDVYCSVDPRNDAHLPLNCGDHSCTEDDCIAAWEASEASSSCPTWEVSYQGHDYDFPGCQVDVRCLKDDGTLQLPSGVSTSLERVRLLCNLDGRITSMGC